MQPKLTDVLLWGHRVPLIVALPIAGILFCLLALCAGVSVMLPSTSMPTPQVIREIEPQATLLPLATATWALTATPSLVPHSRTPSPTGTSSPQATTVAPAKATTATRTAIRAPTPAVPTAKVQPTATVQSANSCPQGCASQLPGCAIKGNINSSGEKIYHVPGAAAYDETKIDPSEGERWFCTEQEASANGWRKAVR